MTLSVAITPTTHQSSPSHSGAHNTLHGIANQYFADKQAGTGVRIDIVTPGAVSNGLQPTVAGLNVVHGSEASPATPNNVPTVFVSRRERTDDNGPASAALYVTVKGDGSATGGVPSLINMPTAVSVSAERRAGSGDTCGFFAIAVHSSSTAIGIAYGLYTQVFAEDPTHSGAIAFQTAVGNDTGSDYPYNTTFNRINVLDLSSAGHAMGCYIQLRGNADVGIGALTGSIVNAFLSDDSSGATSYRDRGAHSTGIDQSGATISGTAAAFKSAGTFQVTVQNAGGDSVLVLQSKSGNSASLAFFDGAAWRISNGYFHGTGWSVYDTVNGRHMLVVDPAWTPAANSTPASLLQGAGPTLRQIKTFNDGTHDVLYLA